MLLNFRFFNFKTNPKNRKFTLLLKIVNIYKRENKRNKRGTLQNWKFILLNGLIKYNTCSNKTNL